MRPTIQVELAKMRSSLGALDAMVRGVPVLDRGPVLVWKWRGRSLPGDLR